MAGGYPADWLGKYDNATSFLYTHGDGEHEREKKAPQLKTQGKHVLTMCDLSKDPLLCAEFSLSVSYRCELASAIAWCAFVHVGERAGIEEARRSTE